MHKAIQDFHPLRDDERVIDQVVKFNSQFYKLDLNIQDIVINPHTVKEGDKVTSIMTHTPHIGNMFKDGLVSKLIAIHILSSRDDIQGGEFRFGAWGEPHRRDNFGKLLATKNPYPVWLNEKGSLFVIPAMEKVTTETIISGELNFVEYVFRGVNYK